MKSHVSGCTTLSGHRSNRVLNKVDALQPDNAANPLPSFAANLPNLQAALVIAGDNGLRKCIVNHLRREGWIVHGIPKAEHALPILAHIPYQLIIVDCELPGIDAGDFVHLLHNAAEWRGLHLVALRNSISTPLAGGLDNLGAFSTSREAWSDDLAHFLGQLAIGRRLKCETGTEQEHAERKNIGVH